MTARPAAGELARFVAGLGASSLLFGLGTLLLYATVPLAAPGWTSTVVGSGSMAPALLTGDVVVIREQRGEAGLTAPAVMLAERPGDIPLLHRVVAHEPGHGYRTKGDANTREDGVRVPESAVIGVGRVVVPWVGLPTLWAREGNLAALAVAVGVLAGLACICGYGWDERYDPWRIRVNPSRDAEAGDRLRPA